MRRAKRASVASQSFLDELEAEIQAGKSHVALSKDGSLNHGYNHGVITMVIAMVITMVL